MRQETNNEMELLLRRLSRRQGVSVPDDDSHNDLDHLDADELSSFAENAVPAAARARYTEHLAECSRCRELVVHLSASVPVVVAGETVTAPEASGLRRFLASFFSPMVLRYAVPALGLIVVAAIGFVALRSSSQRRFTAQLEGSVQNKPTQVQNEQFRDSSGFGSEGRKELPSQPTASASEAGAVKDSKTIATPNAEPGSGAGDVRVEQQRDVPAPAGKLEAVANAPAPAPPAATPAPTVEEMRVDVQAQRANESVGRVASTGDLAKQKAAEGAKDQETAASRQPAKARAAAPQTGGTSSAFKVDDKDKKKDEDVIRSVGGRGFRRQGGVWVDTAYDSGSAVVTVMRNSEQYRALVADEPTIKTIADTLDGTIVVVWKGRAYRIR